MKKLIVFLMLISVQMAFSQWEMCNKGLTDSIVRVLAVNGSNLFAGTCSGGVFVSTDNGSNWIQKNIGIDDLGITAFGFNGSSIYAGSRSGVYLSTNNGDKWVKLASLTGDAFNGAIYSIAVKDSNIIVGGMVGLFISSNNGVSWVSSNISTAVYTILIKGQNLFLGTFGGIYLSTDFGKSWNWCKNGINADDYCTQALISDGTNILAGTNYGPIYLSSDNGSSWKLINQGVPDSSFVHFIITGNNLVYAQNNKIYSSSDVGKSWSVTNSVKDDVPDGICSLVMNGDYLFAGSNLGSKIKDESCWGTGMGVYRSKLSDLTFKVMTSVNSAINVSPEMMLYPNPGTNIVNISNIPASNDNIKINVMDGNGKIIKSFNFNNGAVIQFDSSDLPSGNYFVQMNTGNKSQTYKLIISK